MMKFEPVLRRIRFAFALASVATLVFGVASYLAIGELARFATNAATGKEKLLVLAQLDTALSRTQVALRDYLLTGVDLDYQRFQARAAEQAQALDALAEPPQVPEQRELERLLTDRTLSQYEVAAIRGHGDVQGALQVLNSPRMQNVDVDLDNLRNAARARAEQAWWDTHAVPTATGAERTVVAAIALLLAMLAWVFWVVRRYERERRRIGGLLDDSEAMSRALTANMAEGLVTMSQDLVVLDMNPAALKVLGYSREEVVGQHSSRFVTHAPRHRDVANMVRRRLEDPTPFQIAGIDVTVLRKDGHRLPAQLALNDVVVGGRRVLTALIHDVSRIRQATEAAQASEQHLREITDTLPVIVAELDTERRFRFVNRAFADFLGIGLQDAVGRDAREMLGEDLHAVHAPHLDKALAGSCVRYEVTVGDANGNMGTYDMRLIPRLAAGTGERVGCYAFATDITALKRIDRMKTEFISTVSHELRTPLTSIRGSLGLLSGGIAGALPENARSLIGIAQNNCDRLIRLINDILDSEKIESGKVPLRLQPVDMTALVRQGLRANEGFAHQHSVRLSLHAPATPLTVRADVDRLQQVLTNLLSNAVKFSPARAAVEVRVSAPAGHVRVEVADHGPGIPQDFQQRIFQKFSQADSSDSRAKSGTGLGLNISRTLVEAMGGQIGFTSTQGEGTTFFFELPRHELPATAPAAPRAPASAPPRKRMVLHVEGDADIRAIVADFAGERATCVPAASLAAARAQLRQRRFDVVLLEPELAEGSGWELLDDLDALPRPPLVIVFSASNAEPPPGRYVHAVLVKAQTSEAALVQALRDAMDGSLTQPMSLGL